MGCRHPPGCINRCWNPAWAKNIIWSRPTTPVSVIPLGQLNALFLCFEPLGHSNQIGERLRVYLAHHSATLGFHRNLLRAQFRGHLLVHRPRTTSAITSRSRGVSWSQNKFPESSREWSEFSTIVTERMSPVGSEWSRLVSTKTSVEIQHLRTCDDDGPKRPIETQCLFVVKIPAASYDFTLNGLIMLPNASTGTAKAMERSSMTMSFWKKPKVWKSVSNLVDRREPNFEKREVYEKFGA
jgi:hypothetical protein